MILRSGFIKCTNSFTCRTCNKFYGCKDFNWKCSYCYNKKTGSQFPWRDPEFRQKVNQWAINEIEKTPSQYVNVIEYSIKMDSKPESQNFNNTKHIIKQLKNMINYAENQTLWISAEKGEELLRRTGKDCDEKSHIICPLILDWWNMKHYNYRGFEMCYYGRFGDESDFEEQIKSIPPPLPNRGFV